MPLQVSINNLAVLVAAIVGVGIGFLWYSQMLFGKAWTQMTGFDKKKIGKAKQKGMGKNFALAFLSTLIMSYILAHFIDYVEAKNAIDGVVLGIWIWIGFFATTQLGIVLWEGKPVKLYLINTLHYLATLAVMGAILAVWV